MPHKATLLLGSNINPSHNLPLAFAYLKSKVKINKYSRVWQTAAVGSEGPDFLNAAVEIHSELSQHQIKKVLIHEIETNLGRTRTTNKNDPRTIDIDIILFEDRIIDHELWKKSFIALPVSDIHPTLINPEDGMTLREKSIELMGKSDVTYPLMLG